MNKHQLLYIQYGNILIRDAPHPTPPHAGAAADGEMGPGPGGHWRVGWGGVA